MSTQLFRVLAACACSVIAGFAYAQPASPQSPSSPPANLAYVDGTVDVIQDGVLERADPPLMLLEGDVVRTRNGRAEVIFDDGTLLHLSHDTELEILDPEHLRLISGRVLIRISHTATSSYVIDTPGAPVRLQAQGEYGVTADRGAGLEVAVIRGVATVDDARE